MALQTDESTPKQEDDSPEHDHHEDPKAYVMKVLREGRIPWGIEDKPENIDIEPNEECIWKILNKYVGNDHKALFPGLETLSDDYSKNSAEETLDTNVILKLKETMDILERTSIQLGAVEQRDHEARSKRYETLIEKDWENMMSYQHENELKEEMMKSKQEEITKEAEEVDLELTREMIDAMMEDLEKQEEKCRRTFNLATASIIMSKTQIRQDKAEKISEATARYKDRINKIMESRRTLQKMIRERKREKKIKDSYKVEQCDICMRKEEEWESYRWSANIDSDPFTTEDARDFHKTLVRNGAMRCLVDNIRNILEAELPQELIFPAFVCNLAHPENNEELHKMIMNGQFLNYILEQVRDKYQEVAQNTMKEKHQYQIETAAKDDEKACFMCQKICNQCNRWKWGTGMKKT